MRKKVNNMESFMGLKIPNYKGPDGISGTAALINIGVDPEEQGEERKKLCAPASLR
jgi:hypothetical protein